MNTPGFAFTANSSSDNISAFTIDPLAGELTAVDGSPFAAGTTPASVTVEPMGEFAYTANGGSNDVSAFSIDTLGSLTPVPGSRS